MRSSWLRSSRLLAECSRCPQRSFGCARQNPRIPQLQGVRGWVSVRSGSRLPQIYLDRSHVSRHRRLLGRGPSAATLLLDAGRLLPRHSSLRSRAPAPRYFCSLWGSPLSRCRRRLSAGRRSPTRNGLPAPVPGERRGPPRRAVRCRAAQRPVTYGSLVRHTQRHAATLVTGPPQSGPVGAHRYLYRSPVRRLNRRDTPLPDQKPKAPPAPPSRTNMRRPASSGSPDGGLGH